MFPMTMTLHSPAQLNAVLRALQPRLADAPEATPERLAAYLEADAGVTAEEKAALARGWPNTFAEAEANQKAAAQVPGKSAAKTARSAPIAAAPVAAAPAQSIEPTAPLPSTAPAAAASSAPELVTYDQVAAAITRAVKVNREKAVDALARFGVRKGPELKPEQYRDFVAALA